MMKSVRHTLHENEDGWPLDLGIDEHGRSIHICADCGFEIPDGTCVDREDSGRIVAWQQNGLDNNGTPIRIVIHECEG